MTKKVKQTNKEISIVNFQSAKENILQLNSKSTIIKVDKANSFVMSSKFVLDDNTFGIVKEFEYNVRFSKLNEKKDGYIVEDKKVLGTQLIKVLSDSLKFEQVDLSSFKNLF